MKMTTIRRQIGEDAVWCVRNSKTLKIVLLVGIVALFAGKTQLFAARPYTVELNKDARNGWELLVDGEQLPVNGVVWSFTPIGENYNYSLWDQDDRFIRKMIDTDGPLLQEMG